MAERLTDSAFHQLRQRDAWRPIGDVPELLQQVGGEVHRQTLARHNHSFSSFVRLCRGHAQRSSDSSQRDQRRLLSGRLILVVPASCGDGDIEEIGDAEKQSEDEEYHGWGPFRVMHRSFFH
jgi:hypothetical protein